MLKILQRSEKDERWWGGWWQGNGQWHWGCEEFGWKRDVEPHEGWDLCLCGSSGGNGGGGIDGSDGKGGEVVLMVVVGKVVLVMVVRVLCFEVFRVVGVLCIGRGGLCRSGAIFVLEVVEGMELVVGCVVGRVVRLVLLCMNGRGYFCVALAWNWWKWPDWVWVGFSLGWLSGRIVSPFGTWFLGQDGRRGRVDGHGGWGCCSGGCGCGASRIFCLFPEWLFGGYDGCESGDRGCGWCGGVRVVEIVCGVRIGVGVGGVGCEEGVVSGRGNVSVADGGGDRWRDCCRFPAGIFGELWEDLPYCFPFTLDIGDVFLYVGL